MTARLDSSRLERGFLGQLVATDSFLLPRHEDGLQSLDEDVCSAVSCAHAIAPPAVSVGRMIIVALRSPASLLGN